MSTDAAGRIYLGDSVNQRLQVFTPEGVFVDQWDGFVKPTRVSWTLRIASSSTTRWRMRFRSSIRMAHGYRPGIWRRSSGSASEPEDIVTSTRTGRVYVADVLEHRVLALTWQ